MANEKITFNTEKLWDFVNNWNPLQNKYFNNESSINQQLKNEIWSLMYLNADKTISKEKNHSVYKAVKQLYFETESDLYEDIIEKTFNKFIYQTVNIRGIDILFNSSYFDIEWQMHYNYDFKKFKSKYYRDHYIHQVRDMYEIIMLLKKLNIEEYCINWFEEKNTNVVCSYIDHEIQYEVNYMPEKKYELYKKIVETHAEFPKVLKENAKKNDKVHDAVYKKYIKKQLYHEFIYSTTIVSGLLHDLGYPLGFLIKTNKSVMDFIPNSMHFISEITNIEYIHSKLNDTLLVKIVGIDEISKRLKEYDHGVLSAIILLLYYYDNGMIYSLSHIDKAVIEMSALIIYNHTIKYQNQEEDKEKCAYQENIFTKNPMSFIFRICDDIQEWDRVYFVNTESSNYMVCNKCHTPIVRIENHKKDHNDKFDSKCNKRKAYESIDYKCVCSSSNFKKINANRYKKTINVVACNEVSLEYPKELNKRIPQDKTIKFSYDLFKLLEIAKYNMDFFNYRTKEIKKLKISLRKQNDLGSTYVDFFISCNPVELKLEILKRYIEKKHIDTLDELFEIINLIRYDIDNDKLNKINKVLKNRLEVYYHMVEAINNIPHYIANKDSKDIDEDYKVYYNEYFSKFCNTDNKYFNELARISSKNYYYANICKKEKLFDYPVTDLKKHNKIYDIYLNLYLPNKEVMFLSSNYMKSDSYTEYLKNLNDDNWNFHLDLYYFYVMNDKLNEINVDNLNEINVDNDSLKRFLDSFQD